MTVSRAIWSKDLVKLHLFTHSAMSQDYEQFMASRFAGRLHYFTSIRMPPMKCMFPAVDS